MANTYNINSKVTIPVSAASLSANTYTITNGGAVGSGTITVNGTNYGSTLNWANSSTQFNSSSGKPIMTIPHGEERVIIDEKAALEVKGKIKINGIDLEERLKTIEQVLMIPERDATMEARYPSLKKKYDEYIKELSKYRMWDTLKGEKE